MYIIIIACFTYYIFAMSMVEDNTMLHRDAIMTQHVSIDVLINTDINDTAVYQLLKCFVRCMKDDLTF